MASSSQSSSSFSSSEPVVIRTPENDLIDQLSGVAAGLANQMYSWAQGVFAKTSQITDQAVGNFFRVSQQMQGLSDNLTDQYNNVFAPQNRSLAKEANEYNSEARQRLDMGAAGARAAMIGDRQRQAAEEALRSYGIDPSSGRYAALDKAAAVQNAATIADQENQQRDRTAQIGRQLRSEAVQVGAQLPAAIANVNNTAIQANTGASNASLANANTGANLMRLPNDYLKTAMDIKLPPTGQKSTSSGSSNGQSSSPDRGGGGGGGGGGDRGGGGGGSGGGGPGFNPTHGDGQYHYTGNGSGARGFGQSSAAIHQLRPYGDDYSTGDMYDWQNGNFPDSWGLNTPDYQQNPGEMGDYNAGYSPQDGYNMNIGPDGYSDNPFQSYNDPWSQQEYGGNGFGENADYDTYGPGNFDQWGGNQDWSASGNYSDPGWENTYDQPVQTDWGNGASAWSDYGQSSGGGSTDFGIDNSSSYDTSSPSSDFYAGDYGTSDGDYYAKGGAVPMDMSPSGGAMVDDVPAISPSGPARLNAGEFVIPQDVALWKGQEFFQKLINQSRQANQQASAKPQQRPMR